MASSSYLMIHNPVNADDLRAAVGHVVHPRTGPAWHLRKLIGRTPWPAAWKAAAWILGGDDPLAIVCFPDGGGLYPAEDEPDQPPGYALVCFRCTEYDRPSHERVAAALGDWLSAQGLRWSWSYEDGPWEPGGRQDS